MFDSLEIIKEKSHKDASLKLNELITQFIEKNEKFNLNYNLMKIQTSLQKIIQD